MIQIEGVVLEKDNVPAIDKAAFVQYKKQIGSRLGLQAWYLRSFGGKTHTYLNANGNGNDEYSFSNVAHVFGIGAKYQLGANASVTVDYGQNRSNLGRYLMVTPYTNTNVAQPTLLLKVIKWVVHHTSGWLV